MSETDKPPNGATGSRDPQSVSPAVARERESAEAEPPLTIRRSAAETAPPDGSVAADAARPPGRAPALPGGVTVPDPRELEIWNQQVRRRMQQKTRRSFLGLGAGAVAAFGAWEWLTTRRDSDGLPWPFRQTLQVNEQLARDYFRTRRLSPTFSPNRVSDRVNGDLGLDDDVDVATWKMQVEGLASGAGPVMLGLDAVKRLPRVEMTTEFKCIEGWSVIVHWAGARFTDFMKAYPPRTQSGDAFSFASPEDLPPYVSMATPDGQYYVGLDMETMLHPQTLLAYEINGQPLSQEHGAPLRLVTTVKYGVKNLKRIGTIRYTVVRPADYWAEQGYDWYIGL